MHAVDPVALHGERALQHARERSLDRVNASVGDARDLGAFGNGYGAVGLLGPLYTW